MNNFLIVLKKDLIDQWRSKKILVLVITFLFVAISSVITAKLMPEIMKAIPATPGLTINLPVPTYKDAIDQFVKNLSQLAIFVLIFVVAGAVVDEKNKKTLELILTKPVSRTLFILSKFKAYFISISAIYLACALIFYFYAVSLFGSFSFNHFILMSLLALIYLFLIISSTIFFSAISNNSILAVAGGFGTMIVFSAILGLFKQIKDYMPYKLISEYQTIIANGWNQNYLVPLIFCFVLIIIFVLLAIASFQEQEIER